MQLALHGAFFVVAMQLFLRAYAKDAGVVTHEELLPACRLADSSWYLVAVKHQKAETVG